MRALTVQKLSIVGALLLAAGIARASSDYPTVIKNKLELAQTPGCIVCHSDDNGGNGTIIKWFGLSMQDYGVQGKRPDLLDVALDRDRDDELDSDADGISDVDELQAGTDPSDGPGQTGGPPRPGRGCGLAGAPGDRSGSALACLAAIFARTARAWSRRRRDRAFRECRA